MNRHRLPPSGVPATRVAHGGVRAPETLWNAASTTPNDPGTMPGPITVSSSDLLLRYWKVVKRHKFLIICITLAGGLAGFLLAARQTPSYQSRLLLEIQS